MSLKIIKAGILDTIQDEGRIGFQSSGINPGGVMDRFSAGLANALLGKKEDDPILELHFPAPVVQFQFATIICITGADFNPVINNVSIPINQPVLVNKNTILEFKKVNSGARCYLSVLGELNLSKWLNSFSTNLKAKAGGYEGRALQKGDVIPYLEIKKADQLLNGRNFSVLPFKAEPFSEIKADFIEIIVGNEFEWLTGESQQELQAEPFKISTVADRMGFRLQGPQLKEKEHRQLISSAVSFGTLQLLPNGQLIVLMADHQTTGGYPRVGHVITAHLPVLAQKKPNETVTFRIVDIETAEQRLWKQYQYLLSVQWAAKFKIEQLLQ